MRLFFVFRYINQIIQHSFTKKQDWSIPCIEQIFCSHKQLRETIWSKDNRQIIYVADRTMWLIESVGNKRPVKIVELSTGNPAKSKEIPVTRLFSWHK